MLDIVANYLTLIALPNGSYRRAGSSGLTMPRQHAFYVTAAIDAGTANQRVAWLLGPFTGLHAQREAQSMVGPARHAANRSDDPRFAFASFGTAKLSLPAGQTFAPGRLDLTLLRLDEIISASVRR